MSWFPSGRRVGRVIWVRNGIQLRTFFERHMINQRVQNFQLNIDLQTITPLMDDFWQTAEQQ